MKKTYSFEFEIGEKYTDSGGNVYEIIGFTDNYIETVSDTQGRVNFIPDPIQGLKKI